MFQAVEETMSKYHSRVVRLLRMKGFLEEKDIIQMSLMSVKETRAIINQLMSEGFVQYQEVVIKQQGKVHLYGLNLQALRHKLTFRIAKTCLNLLERDGGLGPRCSLAFELNHLYF